MKRSIPIVVISDVHLGTYGCHAEELLVYLNNIEVETLIINGDFIDFWQFKKTYFPEAHLKVIQKIIKMSTSGTKVYYITGNHDDRLRTFSDLSLGNIHLRDKLLLQLNNKKYWIFHGDVFDASIRIAPALAKMGGKGYDLLILLNRWINKIRQRLGKQKMSFSKKLKSSIKKAVKHIGDFEKLAITLAAKQGYDYVICGHIHEPANRKEQTPHGSVHYLNSGDWVESLTSLEYDNETWSVFNFMDSTLYDGFEVKRKDLSSSNINNQSIEDIILHEQKGIAEFIELLKN